MSQSKSMRIFVLGGIAAVGLVSVCSIIFAATRMRDPEIRTPAVLMISPVREKPIWKSNKLPRFLPHVEVPCLSVSHKPLCLLTYLTVECQNCREQNPLVIYLDDDVITNNWTAQRLARTFEAMDTKMVVGLDRTLWPKCIPEELSNGDFRREPFFNTGFAIGYARDLIEIFTGLVEYAETIEHRNDQELMHRYFVHIGKNEKITKPDYDRIFIKNLGDWNYWHIFEGQELREPAFFDACRRDPFYCSKDAHACYNQKLHIPCIAATINCEGLYEIDGCLIKQRRMSGTKRLEDVTEEDEAEVAAGGDFHEVFLPDVESFAYHGNGPGGRTFVSLRDRYAKSCFGV